MYSYIFAQMETHERIKTLKQLKKILKLQDLMDGAASMGLLKDGKGVGSGQFRIENYRKKYLHTEFTEILKQHRRKGHGIHLYDALIRCAKKLGAKRLYSSRTLNRMSTRMWKKKLPAFGYKVETTRCIATDGEWMVRYFIEL